MPAVPEHDTRQRILDALEAAALSMHDIVDVEVVGSKKNPCASACASTTQTRSVGAHLA